MSNIRRETINHPHALSPTPELRQHHEIAPPRVDRKVRREAHAIVSQLESLVDLDRPNADRHIGASELEAGERWRKDFDQAEGVRSGDSLALGRGGGTKYHDGITGTMIDAAARLRAAKDALGPVAITVLRQLIAYDASWVEIGHMIGVSDKTARIYACKALRALAAHYAQVDGVRARDSAPIRAAHAD